MAETKIQLPLRKFGNTDIGISAQAYGDGESERNLPRAIPAAGIDNDAIPIATKWWPVLKTAKNLKETIDDRLDCLSGYAIDHHIT